MKKLTKTDRNPQKLVFAAETLRSLSEPQLAGIVGGRDSAPSPSTRPSPSTGP